MNTFSIKIIFLFFTLCIFLYCASYAGFEIKQKNNILGGILVFIFDIACVIFGNVMFWIS